MDLGEYGLTEQERLLRRAGVLYLWREQAPMPSVSAGPDGPTNTAISSAVPTGCDIPAHLAALFHEQQHPVRSLWLYAGLAEDLGLPSSPQRLVLFRQIQESVCTHLHWKKSDIAGWPLDVEGHVLHQGLEHFQPQVVIAFAHSLDAPEIKTLQQQLIEICPRAKFSLLPNITAMASGRQDLKNMAWRILQDISSDHKMSGPQ